MTIWQWIAAVLGAAALGWFVWELIRPYSPDDRKNWHGGDDE